MFVSLENTDWEYQVYRFRGDITRVQVASFPLHNNELQDLKLTIWHNLSPFLPRRLSSIAKGYPLMSCTSIDSHLGAQGAPTVLSSLKIVRLFRWFSHRTLSLRFALWPGTVIDIFAFVKTRKTDENSYNSASGDVCKDTYCCFKSTLPDVDATELPVQEKKCTKYALHVLHSLYLNYDTRLR